MTYILAGSGALFVTGALLFLLGTFRLPAACRPYGYAATVACGGMGVAYLIMVPVELAGMETDFTRFAGYSVVWIAICFVVGAVANAGRRLTLALLGVVLARLWITYASWSVDGAVGLFLTLSTFAALFVGVYLLFGPFMRAIETISGERALLYSKLRNLVVLAWVGLVVAGLLNGVGITDDFVGLFLGIYVEAILLLGFGGILIRSVDALEDTAETDPLLPFDIGPLESDSDPDADISAAD
ncbi:bacteriorhodopsin [Natronorubrum halalkaliphilum]